MRPPEDPHSARAAAPGLIAEARRLHRAGQTDDALRRLDQVVVDGGTSSPRGAILWSDAQLLKASYLREAGRHEPSIAATDALIERFRDEPAAEIRDRVADAWLLKGLELLALGATREALAEFDVLTRRLADPSTDRQRTTLARTLVVRGAALRELGRMADAIAAWQRVVDRFESDPPADEPFVVGEAIRLRSEVQAACGQVDEAVISLDQLMAQYDAGGSADERIGLVEACATRARLLAAYGRRVTDERTLITLSRVLGEPADPDTLVQMTDPILDAAAVMVTGELADAVAGVLESLLGQLSVSSQPLVRAAWARVQLMRLVYLVRLGDVEAAMGGYDALVDVGDAVLSTWDELEQRAHDARLPALALAAELGRAASLAGMGHREDALHALDKAIDRHALSPQARRIGRWRGLSARVRDRRRDDGAVSEEVTPFIALAELARAALASADS
jgi:tetratricopeptide (TPR) repeat protein